MSIIFDMGTRMIFKEKHESSVTLRWITAPSLLRCLHPFRVPSLGREPFFLVSSATCLGSLRLG